MAKMALAALLLAGALVGCTQRPESIAARPASAEPYRAMACTQINDERMRVGVALQRDMALQRSNADADAAISGVGVMLFPPLLLGLTATTDRREQISSLMGERDALEIVARDKSCPPITLPQ